MHLERHVIQLPRDWNIAKFLQCFYRTSYGDFLVQRIRIGGAGFKVPVLFHEIHLQHNVNTCKLVYIFVYIFYSHTILNC